MKVRAITDYIVKRDDLQPLKVHPDNNPYHSAHVTGYRVGVSIDHASFLLPSMTLDDLKELRRALRKFIKDESN